MLASLEGIMGINQTFNEINELINCDDRLETDERSVKQMLIDKGEWTDEDEEDLKNFEPDFDIIRKDNEYEQ